MAVLRQAALVTLAFSATKPRAPAEAELTRVQSFAALWLLMNSQGSAGAEGGGLPNQASRVDQV